MIAKIVVLFAVVAVAYGGLTVAPAPLVYSAGSPLVYSAQPVAVASPIAIPQAVAYSSGAKVETIVEPVEQHGYRIAY